MSATDKPQKINIGFTGGQVVTARVKDAELARLRGELGKSGGFFELASEDGVLVLDLTKVDYLLVASGEQRVGF